MDSWIHASELGIGGKKMWDLLVRNRGFLVSLGVILSIILFGVVGPRVVRDPHEMNRDQVGFPRIFERPSSEFILGTDDYGHDVFAQLAHGTKNSLKVGFITGSLVVLIAVIMGSLGAYKGGWADEISMLVTNIAIVFPMLPLLIILAAFLEQRSLYLVGFLIAIVAWPWAARAIRSQVLSLKERDFVKLARATAMRDRTVAIVEVLPNMLAYILMVLVIALGGGIVAEAGISMIGLGPTETITLGTMLYWSIANETVRSGFWWLFVPPGLILTVFLVALYILHSCMDEVFNPRLRTM